MTGQTASSGRRDLEPRDEEPLVAEIVGEDGGAPEGEPARVPEGPVTVGDLVEGASRFIEDVGTSARRLVDRGRYRKVRISRKGKQVLPDIPLAAVAAIQAASMYGAGVARVLAVNVGAKFLFDIDVVNEADKFLERGRQALLEGDLEAARAMLERAVRIDDTHAESFLQLGVLCRLEGDVRQAILHLERAKALDELGEVGKRAATILTSLRARI